MVGIPQSRRRQLAAIARTRRRDEIRGIGQAHGRRQAQPVDIGARSVLDDGIGGGLIRTRQDPIEILRNAQEDARTRIGTRIDGKIAAEKAEIGNEDITLADLGRRQPLGDDIDGLARATGPETGDHVGSRVVDGALGQGNPMDVRPVRVEPETPDYLVAQSGSGAFAAAIEGPN
jgi:hypothetical protein